MLGSKRGSSIVPNSYIERTLYNQLIYNHLPIDVLKIIK